MDFRTYRQQQGWTLDEAASYLSTTALRFTGSMVRKHELGIELPNPLRIERYAKLTSGEVTGQHFLDARRERMRAAEKADAD